MTQCEDSKLTQKWTFSDNMNVTAVQQLWDFKLH